ncbi:MULTISPECIES: hypothetical protein [Stenotrophomonas]|jgi:hypothetical protein|uniref:Secreted protein n=1 Tax=Stenotrophomonas aracearum TaxID=3003272 RepID=A0ABY9YAV1_9GAMM|nr:MULTISPECIES: hypothetical protein [unclassified Stenotrophomonas]WNH47965.1 hypothetical protein PDM28_14960 [Stenotrophomonas sp. A5588]
MYRIGSIVMMLALAGSAHALAATSKDAVQMGGAKPVAEQIREVELAMASDKYSELTLENKSAVQASLNQIRAQMGDHERIDQVAPQNKVAIFNEQEKINTILTQGHADSRLVCRREKTVGSNFPTNNCMTVAERRRATENARTNMRDVNRSQLIPLD